MNALTLHECNQSESSSDETEKDSSSGEEEMASSSGIMEVVVPATVCACAMCMHA